MEHTRTPWYMRKSDSYKVSRPVESLRTQAEFRTRSLGSQQYRFSSSSLFGSSIGGRYVSRSPTRSSGLGPSVEGSAYSGRSIASADSLYGSMAYDMDKPPGLYRTRSIEELLDKYAPLPIPKKDTRIGRSAGSLDRLAGRERLKYAIAYSGAKIGAIPVISPTSSNQPRYARSKSTSCDPFRTRSSSHEPELESPDVVDDVFSSDDNNVLTLEDSEDLGFSSSTDPVIDSSSFVTRSSHTSVSSSPIQSHTSYRDGSPHRPTRLNITAASTQTSSCPVEFNQNRSQPSAFTSPVASPTRLVQTSPTRHAAHQLSSSSSSITNTGSLPNRTPLFHKYNSATELGSVHSNLSQCTTVSSGARSCQSIEPSSIYALRHRHPSGSLDTAKDIRQDILGPDSQEEYTSTDYLKFNLSSSSFDPPPSPNREISVIKTSTARNSPPSSPDIRSSEASSPIASPSAENIVETYSKALVYLSPVTGRSTRKFSVGSDSAVEMSLSDDDHQLESLLAESKRRKSYEDIGKRSKSRTDHDFLGRSPENRVTFISKFKSSNNSKSSTITSVTYSSCTSDCQVMSSSDDPSLDKSDSKDSDGNSSSKQPERPLSPRIPFRNVQTPSFTKIIHHPPSVVISDHSHDEAQSPKSPLGSGQSPLIAPFPSTAADTENIQKSIYTSGKSRGSFGSSGDLSTRSTELNLDSVDFLDKPNVERRLSFSSTGSDRSDSIKSVLSDSSYSIDDDDYDYIPSTRKLSISVRISSMFSPLFVLFNQGAPGIKEWREDKWKQKCSSHSAIVQVRTLNTKIHTFFTQINC